jgi:hypothetical protein
MAKQSKVLPALVLVGEIEKNVGLPVLVRVGNCTAAFTAYENAQTVRLRLRPMIPTRHIIVVPSCPTRPSELGKSADDRRLGIGFISIKIED